MRLRALAAGLALGALLAAGCAPASPAPKPRAAGVSLTLPFVAQEAPQLCGLACAEMLARSYGHPLCAGCVRALREEAAATGWIRGASLQSALERSGYEVAVYPGTLDRGPTGLFKQVDKGLPVLVMTGAGPSHYSVVAGYDEGLAQIVLMDPVQGKVNLPFATFEAQWGRAGHFALLAAPAKG